MRDAVLIFDLDGTLFLTESVTVPAVQDSFREARIEVPAEAFILNFIGSPMSELAQWVQSVCGNRDADAIMRQIDGKEMALVESIGQLFPNVSDVLRSLRKDYRTLAICTNGGPDYANRVIDSQGIRQFFDVVRCRTSHEDNKPAMVAEIIGNAGLTEGVVTGDRREDVEAARRNSLRAIGAGYGYGSEDELEDADAVAHAASEIPNLVSQLLGN
ncbi:MAG: HAD hydrolase-like protein [SAR202 cluster bacterium]|nr:HAD hydrolase-like protein [SAR202 cluster bacterium]MDP6713861.1 HAD hydrolase-like protein [SAR202 cluster bacterium]